MNTVTFETAIALKDAGFPQPERAPGQFWYNQKGLLHVVFIEGGEGRCFLSVDDGDAWPCVDEGYIFAPQAHDILEQLPEGWILSLNEKGAKTTKWCCRNLSQPIYDVFENGMEVFYGEFLHDAAAKAFSELKKAEK